MKYLEVKEKCLEGYTVIIPGWEGYLDYSPTTQQLVFHNRDYTMTEEELESFIKNRDDLYYII